MNIPTVALFVVFASLLSLTKARDCVEDCTVPTLVYDDLKCTPIYASPTDCCPQKYDCSHIYTRPKGTCHFRGKIYKPGETPIREDFASSCEHGFCECAETGLKCVIPSDSCAEFWVPDYVKPGCYLTYEMNRCCNNGQKCPPFDNDAKCNVNGVIYKEGQRMDHPGKKCTFCICDKEFDGKLEAPFCQKRNCTTEVRHSKEVDDHCAPLYQDLNSCCPQSWICPSESGVYIPASKPPTDRDLQCKFGEKTLLIGEKYETQNRFNRKISCECVIPPYLTCVTS